MLRSWMSLPLVGILLAFSTGCSSFGGSAELKDENARLLADNQRLRSQLEHSEGALRSAPSAAQLQAMQSEVAAREARIRELEAQLRKPEPGAAADPSIAGIDTSYDRKKGELTVTLPSDVLFDSGSADLKSTSRTTLEKVVAAIRKDYAGKRIRVEGHTDRDPIVQSRKQWIDNLDLSLNRSASVSRFLVERGVDRSMVATVGWGDAYPKGGKATSRRVEIIIVVG